MAIKKLIYVCDRCGEEMAFNSTKERDDFLYARPAEISVSTKDDPDDPYPYWDNKELCAKCAKSLYNWFHNTACRKKLSDNNDTKSKEV